MENSQDSSNTTLKATPEEMEAFKTHLENAQPESLDIPFAFTVVAVTIAGVAHIKDPIENSWIEGGAVGAINGTFKLDKNKQNAKLYDPTGIILRLVAELKIPSNYFRVRIDTRKWTGEWNKGTWIYVRF